MSNCFDQPGTELERNATARGGCVAPPHFAIEKKDIAALSERDIAYMPLGELEEVLESAQHYFSNGQNLGTLKGCDRKVLEQLVIRARSCCRAQGY